MSYVCLFFIIHRTIVSIRNHYCTNMDRRSEDQKIDMVAKAERLEVELGRVPTVVDEYHALDPDDAAAVERSLLRKIDLRILPLVVLIYIFNYLDRNSITQARLYGLQKDTDVKGAVYQTAISIFSAGYIVMQLPSTLLMTKLRPSLFLPICIIAWAVVSGCTAATNSAAGLLTVRFFLGIIEAPFFPGAIYFLSCWYTPRELGVRMALLICGLLLSNSFAGLISAGILSGMAGVGHLHAWRWLFILEGSATVLLGLVAMVVLPDYPGTTKWLSDKEKIVAQARLSKAAGTTEALGDIETPVLKAVAWAAKDYRVWIFACLQMATTACISYSHFFPTLIQGLGFKDNKTVLLLTSPPYLFAFCWVSVPPVVCPCQTTNLRIGHQLRLPRRPRTETLPSRRHLLPRDHLRDNCHDRSSVPLPVGPLRTYFPDHCRHFRGLQHYLRVAVLHHHASTRQASRRHW
jgi:MFS family permease